MSPKGVDTVHYTNEQYAMMERFEHGLNVTQLSEEEKFLFCFLQGENLLQPRADMEDGLFFLSEHGKRVLSQHREDLQKAKQEARQLAEKNAKEDIRSKSSDIACKLFRRHLRRVLYRDIFSFCRMVAEGAGVVYGFVSLISCWPPTSPFAPVLPGVSLPHFWAFCVR